MADLVIRGGMVIDGTGAPGERKDLAIDGDRVAAIGPRLSGARTLDATGCVVAPGFFDIHTHDDAQVFWAPALTPSFSRRDHGGRRQLRLLARADARGTPIRTDGKAQLEARPGRLVAQGNLR